MKTFLHFILTCFISTGAFMAALTMKNPIPGFAIAFAAWIVFGIFYRQRSRKAVQKRVRERLFEEYMRSNVRDAKR